MAGQLYGIRHLTLNAEPGAGSVEADPGVDASAGCHGQSL
jgi:hypothetical protein